MKYTIGNYEFTNTKDYDAARRDLVKLRTLEKRGKTKTEIAKNYKIQIRVREIRFESCIGCGFAYKPRIMPTKEPLKRLKASYTVRNPVIWGFLRLKYSGKSLMN